MTIPGGTSARRVLMVAIRFPPYAGVGAIRTLKFEKFLPDHGWVADVLTAPAEPGLGFGPPLSEASRYGHGHVFRLPYADPVGAYSARSVTGSRNIHSASVELTAPIVSMLQRILVPDEHVFFAAAATVAGDRILSSRRYDAVYASGMPWSGFLAALAISCRRGLPTIVDFRDPWLQPGPNRAGTIRRALEAGMEATVVRRATRVIVTAPSLRSDILSRYPDTKPSKVVVIENGYDEDDFRGRLAAARPMFTVLHAGSFYGSKGLSDLLVVMRAWFECFPERRGRAVLRLVGGVRSRDLEKIRDFGLSDAVEVVGRVAHSQAIAEIVSADALVAVDYGPESARLRILAKAFEYMRSGRPILFLSSDGDTADLLRPIPTARIIPKRRTDLAVDELERLARLPRSFAESAGTESAVRVYERRCLTKRLAAVLDGAAATSA